MVENLAGQKPKPTDNAAASHWSLSQETPSDPNTVIAPTAMGDGVGGALGRIFRRERTSTSSKPQVANQRLCSDSSQNNRLPMVTFFTTAAPASVPL